jgi:hypothetical protein
VTRPLAAFEHEAHYLARVRTHMNNERARHATETEAEQTETVQVERPAAVPQPTSGIKRLIRR